MVLDPPGINSRLEAYKAKRDQLWRLITEDLEKNHSNADKVMSMCDDDRLRWFMGQVGFYSRPLPDPGDESKQREMIATFSFLREIFWGITRNVSPTLPGEVVKEMDKPWRDAFRTKLASLGAYTTPPHNKANLAALLLILSPEPVLKA
jgi:hypothetical protein